MLEGTIVKGIGGFYYVDTTDGLYECRARGIFRKNKVTPTVGDMVEISVLDKEKKKGSLDVIKPRKNELIRPRVANVEQAVIVFSCVSPQINLDLLDRFLILAQEQSLEILLCLNKIDLDTEKSYEKIAEIYQKAGYAVLLVSAEKKIGIEALKEKLSNKISVVAGPSGVGKSSLINAVCPHLGLTTGQISAKIERGRHTTRHAQLMELFLNSYIVDSPGFTSLYLDHIPKEDLKEYFVEFAPFENACRYNGCSHTHEPDCEVKKHVGEEISQERYERYVSLYQQLSEERK